VLLVQNSVAPTAYSVDKATYSRLRLTLHDVCGQQTTGKTQKQEMKISTHQLYFYTNVRRLLHMQM